MSVLAVFALAILATLTVWRVTDSAIAWASQHDF